MENLDKSVNILIWYERGEIRITKQIIDLLGTPTHIQLQIDKDKMQVVIVPCKAEDYSCFAVPKNIDAKSGMRIYSLNFLTILHEKMNWNESEKYILYGKWYKNNVVAFDLNTWELLSPLCQSQK